ncbi:MAG: flippase-like domain-containing protein [Methanoregulaceae archaeon]|nr:flippase-like domain-containing protein [Methanoregulaceae archaeon]
MERSQARWIWISIAFSVAVIVVVIATTFNESTLKHILTLNLFFLAGAFGLRIASLLFWSARIRSMSLSLGYRVKFSHAFNLVLANLLAGAITPGQTGGEPVRIHELYRADVKIGDATAVVIMERVLDGIVLTVMGVLAMLLLGRVWQGLSVEVVIIVVIAWVFMIGVIAGLLISARNPQWIKVHLIRLLKWLSFKFPGGRFQKMADQADCELDNFFSSMNHFTGKSRRGLFYGTIFTVLFWTSEFLVASLLLMSLGQQPFIAESFLFQLVIAIIMMVPLTPGSSGIAEISASSLYILIVPASILGIFILLWRLLLYYFNIAVGLIASVSIFKRELTLKEEVGTKAADVPPLK